MTYYHATPASNREAIEAEGLDPFVLGGLGAGSARVHVHENPGAAAGFVSGLYRCDVVVFEVDCSGLELEPGDDDDEEEWAYSGRIGPERLRLANTI